MTKEDGSDDLMAAYGISKSACGIYAAMSAKKYPSLKSSSITPGYVDTAITAGYSGDKKTPEEGTVSIRKCLFEDLKGNGWFYGSDGLRSPLCASRDPGTPEYDGN